MTDRAFRVFGAALIALPLTLGAESASAIGEGLIGGLFSNGGVKVFSTRGQNTEEVKLQTEAALETLANYTFLSENDARQYARDPQGLLGYYVKIGPDKKLQLLGGSRKVVQHEFDLKNETLFRVVVDKKYDASIGIPILKVGLEGNDIAEVSVQDVVTVSSEFTADGIACNFPHSWRGDYDPSGSDKYYYIPNATVSTIRSRRFSSSSQEADGVFSMLSVDGGRYYSSEAVSAKYFVTVSLIPVRPLEGAICSQLKTVRDFRLNETIAGLQTDFVNMSALGQPTYAGRHLPAKQVTGAEAVRTSPKDLQGATLAIAVEAFPGASLE